MQTDQRLTPLPHTNDLLTFAGDYTGKYPGAYDDAFDNKRSIRQYFNILYKRLPIILAIALIGTIAVAIYSYRQPAIYEAEVKMIVEPRKPPQTQKDGISINLNDDQKYYKTQVELLQTPELMKGVVVALGLHRDANLFANRSGGVFGQLFSLVQKSPTPSNENNMLPVVSSSDPEKKHTGELVLTPEENNRAKAYVKVLLDQLKVKQKEGTNISQHA